MPRLLLLLVLFAWFYATPIQAQVVVDLPPTGPQPYFVDEYARQVPIYEGSYALLISERSYLGAARNGWRPLDATPREMDLVAETLRSHGFFVRRATDLSSSELNTTFREFMAEFGQRANHRILFFFSGHGYTSPQNEMGYIVPIDALDPNIDPRRFYSRALPIDTIQTWARELAARHVLFLFDSCFSGSIFMSRGPVVTPDARGAALSERLAFFKGSAARPVRQFISAGGPKEELPATSIFVPLFIEAINGQATRVNDGYVTGKELGLWLEQTVPRFRATQNPHSGVIRQPELAFGDMIFQQPRPSIVQVPRADPPPIVAIAPTTSPLPVSNAASTPKRPAFEKVNFSADVFFEYDKSLIKAEAKAKLEDLAGKAKKISLEVIVVVGHTDSVEGKSDAYAQKASVRRAEAVKAFLVSLGIEPSRVYTEGKGNKQPVADNKTAEGRAKNRRAEIEVVGTRPRSQS